ncbi:MAG: hypothetical protein MUF49_32825 [Oculatellaceae cyanobacterium Prado106]|jgi:hypothetical protein|nr:hypothetical protein [Oculatellaceae cyanobacterium Prado106]
MDFGLIARDSSTGGLETEPIQAIAIHHPGTIRGTIRGGFLQLVENLR